MSAPDDELDGLSDNDLNETLSALLPAPEHRWVESLSGADQCHHCGYESWQPKQKCRVWWCGATDEVLKLLNRLGPEWSSRTYGNQTVVDLSFVGIERGEARGIGPTLARAGVVAAVRALRYDLAATAKLKGVALCGRCGQEMRPNVPRLSWTAGAVHKATGLIACADQSPQQGGFVT